MTQRRVPAPLVAALLVFSLLPASLVPAGAGEPPGGWTKAVKVKQVADDLGHDAVVVDDRAHAVFAGRVGEDPERATIFYGTNATPGASWSFEKVGEVSSVTGLRPAIALSPEGVVHIVYHYRAADGIDRLDVANNADGTWTIAPLAGPGGADIELARFPDIAMRPDGSPAIVFTGAQQAPCTGESDLFLTEYSGTEWSQPTNVSAVDTNCREHTFPALAAGADGLHLAYRAVDPVTSEVGVHYRSGALTNATDETIDPVADGEVLEFGVDLILDGTGSPHVVYLANIAGTGDSVWYAGRDAGQWTPGLVLGGGGEPITGDPSIAIGADGPAVGFAEGDSAFVGEDTTEGWNIKNLNVESTRNRDVVLASTPGNLLHAVLIRHRSDDDQLLYMHEAPRAQTEFAVAGAEFRGGEEVDMSGDIDPATVREQVKIETQKFKDGSWRAYDLKKLRTRANGSFDYTHEPFPAGKKYRSRLIWGDTIDHLDGRTVWDNFLVERKRAH